MSIKKNKIGEMTTQQLVMLIVLIVSFVIILFLIFRLNLGGTTDAEICHNSVVLKGQSDLTSGPLDCKTDYICISGGGDCSEFSSSAQIKIDAENKTQIMEAIADEMANCWYMFGEGKIDYGSGFLSKSVSCGICSIISFDNNIQDKTKEISYAEFYDYLKNTKKDSSQTYLYYLYKVNDLQDIGDKEYFGFDMGEKIETSQKYSLITGVDMNVKVLFVGNEDKYLNTFIIPTSQTSQTSCDEFVTKA
jgi:hypothetical protein